MHVHSHVSSRWALCCLLACLALATSGAGAPPALRVQTIDVLTMAQTGHAWQARFTRQIGLGMDGKPGATFDALLVDRLPRGIRLLAPSPGTLQLRAVDGRTCPLTISRQIMAAASVVKLAARGLPVLPEGQPCCDCRGCGGGCGRACSVSFSYSTNAVVAARYTGAVRVATPEWSLPVGKTSSVMVYVTARSLDLRNPALSISIPAVVNGATLRVKHYSPALRPIASPAKLTRLSTHAPFHALSLAIELAVTPTRAGRITLDEIAELGGLSTTPLRPAPILPNAPHTVLDRKTYLRVKKSIELFAT